MLGNSQHRWPAGCRPVERKQLAAHIDNQERWNATLLESPLRLAILSQVFSNLSGDCARFVGLISHKRLLGDLAGRNCPEEQELAVSIIIATLCRNSLGQRQSGLPLVRESYMSFGGVLIGK
jgi:hypothetical protein